MKSNGGTLTGMSFQQIDMSIKTSTKSIKLIGAVISAEQTAASTPADKSTARHTHHSISMLLLHACVEFVLLTALLSDLALCDT